MNINKSCKFVYVVFKYLKVILNKKKQGQKLSIRMLVKVLMRSKGLEHKHYIYFGLQ